ncbi:MAG TPA: hypothetical protein VHB01_11795 [Nitrosospira sp.]|nr:hypothetical protein [Nitrosospira sp.]
MPAPQHHCGAIEASPPLPDPRFAGPSGHAPGRSLARSLTRQIAHKAPSPSGLR